MIRVESMAVAAQVIRNDAEFAPVDLPGYLRLLQAESGVDLQTLVHLADNTPFFVDGPRHQLLHELAVKYLVASRLEPWRPFVQQAVQDQISFLWKRIDLCDSIDVVNDFIDPLFRKVVGAVLGFDTCDAQAFRAWIHSARDLLEPLVSLRQMKRLQLTIRELKEHIRTHELPQHPDAPVSVLQRMRADAPKHGFTEEDVLALTVVLFVASQTTTQTMSNIVHALLEIEPQQRPPFLTVGSDPAAAMELETLLRLHASPQFVDRIARKDAKAGGCPFQHGDHLHMHLPTLNRDRNAFGEGRVNTRIASAGHLSFGGGAHRCPGATFARMVLGIALPALFTQLPQLALVPGGTEWEDNTFIHAPGRMICAVARRG